MTREQAAEEAHKLMDECNRKVDEAREKLRKEGKLEGGMDGNRDIEKVIHKEYFDKLQQLASMIDE